MSTFWTHSLSMQKTQLRAGGSKIPQSKILEVLHCQANEFEFFHLYQPLKSALPRYDSEGQFKQEKHILLRSRWLKAQDQDIDWGQTKPRLSQRILNGLLLASGGSRWFLVLTTFTFTHMTVFCMCISVLSPFLIRMLGMQDQGPFSSKMSSP